MSGKVEKNFFVITKIKAIKAVGYADANQKALTFKQQGEQDVIALTTFGEVPEWLTQIIKSYESQI